MTEQQYLERATAMRAEMWHLARAMLTGEQDAMDAVQEAMLRGWKARHSLKDADRFKPWLMRILANVCRDQQRGRLKRKNILAAAEAAVRSDDRPPDTRDLHAALRALEREYRLPVLMYYFGGYTQQDIANILDLSLGQAKLRIARARERLREMLSDGGDFYE